jgi:esterase/lipase superfamily enzyme
MGVRLSAFFLMSASLIAALVFGIGAARAQTLPASCPPPSAIPLVELEKRKQALERDVALKSAAERLGSAGRTKDLESDLRKTREQLLDVLFRIECERDRVQVPPATGLTRGAAPPPSPSPERRTRAVPTAPQQPQLLEITTYYATNRKQSASAEPVKFYGPQLESTFRYGRATITIPPTHTPGNLEMPTLWKLEREADPNKHFVLKAVVPLGADAARAEMSEKLQGMSTKSVLLFVHGYNTNFAEAALRTAQLAHDLRFPGMAFFYSWPSAGSALSYWQDEETAQLSESIFEQLLGELTRLPVTDIYIVAHSMGNRIVTGALKSRVDKKESTKQIRELLLAAPDINAELFRTVIAPRLAAMQGTRTTIYASSSDLALRASKIVHGFQRVGDTIGGVFVFPRFDTIDASGASTVTRSYGHSYLMDSSSVLKDIQALIQQRVAAKQRGLLEMGAAPNSYWRLQ